MYRNSSIFRLILVLSVIVSPLYASILATHNEIRTKLGLEYIPSAASSSSSSSSSSSTSSSKPTTLRTSTRTGSTTPNLSPSPNPAGNTMNINLIELGADPIGVNDSTAILQSALDTAALYHSTYSLFIEINLQGGNYLISSSLYLKNWNYSGFIIRNGQISVNPSVFPNDGFIFHCVYCQQITWMDLVLENNHVGGGIYVDTALQNVIDNVFFLHYRTMGIYGGSFYGMGHELLVSSSVFAEYMWGEENYNVTANQNGTAIYMTYPDNNFYNIIIRCTKIGIVNRAGANLYHGVHVYSTCNKDPDGVNVAIGYLSDASQNRITNCYFDDSPLILADVWSSTITNNLFYGLSNLIIAPQQHNVWINGILVKNNIFTSTSYSSPYGPRILYDTTNGTIDGYELSDVIIDDNAFSLPNLEQSTRVTGSILVNGSIDSTSNLVINFTLDLSKSLLFLNDYSGETITPDQEGTTIEGIRLGRNPAWKWYEVASHILEFMDKEQNLPFGALRNRMITTMENDGVPFRPVNYIPAGGYGGAFAQVQGTVAFATAHDSQGNTVPPFALNIVPILNLAPMYDSNGKIMNGILNGMVYCFNNNENSQNMNATFQLLVTVRVDQAFPTSIVPN